MTQDESKRKAAEAALAYIKDVEILGVGTGSTVNHFIDCLADFNLTNDIKGAVSSSIATTERLKKIGIPVMELS
ncbi:MAG: ribose 5-phosphate isomerase A, partial [Gammaproteobacteria bacterium]